MTHRSQSISQNTKMSASDFHFYNASANASIGSQTSKHSSEQHGRPSPGKTALADTTNITIQYCSCGQDADFILYPGYKQSYTDSVSYFHTAVSQSHVRYLPRDALPPKQYSGQGLEGYMLRKENFEKVALGVQTDRAIQSVLDPNVLRVLDTL